MFANNSASPKAEATHGRCCSLRLTSRIGEKTFAFLKLMYRDTKKQYQASRREAFEKDAVWHKGAQRKREREKEAMKEANRQLKINTQ
jgi:hypothetical protein